MASLLELLVQNWVVVAVLSAILALFWFARHSSNNALSPYERRGPLVTDSELRFYRALQSAVGGSWSVFAMVRLTDLVKVRKGIAAAQTWRNKSFGKHIDFVICDNDSLHVCLAIELDDASHQRPDRQLRDAFVNEALRSAGLPLLRVPVADHYDKIELRKTIDQMLGKK